ncbi:ATP-binding protein [Meiothermus hypogaeus]|nr:AAA family ATPase [Meiothermus hypogaeus]
MDSRSTSTTQTAWQLQLLGGARLRGPRGESRLQWRVAGVLAYLALEGTTPKYRLASWLWPDSSEATARNNLRQALKRLRDSAGADLIVGDEQIALVDWLEVDAVQLSAHAFAGEYAKAAALEGELLQGLDFDECPDFDEWLAATRESLNALRRDATMAEAERLEQAGQYSDALSMARQVLELDDVSEEAHRRLMRLHYLLGDRGAALAAFERCRAILEREFRAEPLPETLELAAHIESGKPIGGMQSVKPREKPAPQTPAAPASALVGREREWALMEQAYQEGKLVFLRGEPGVGKTRLAMEFAASKGPVMVNTPRPGDRGVPFSTYAREVRKVAALQPEAVGSLPDWVRRELSRLVPELNPADPPPPISSEVEKIRLFDALAELNRVAQRGYVIVGDDAQYMDAATMEALVYLLGKFGGVGNPSLEFTIQVYRKGELDPEMEQNVVYSLVNAGMAVLIDVEPLPSEAVGKLLETFHLEGLEQMATQMTRFTGGNPLFVLETVRHLQETGQLERGWPGRLPPPGKVGTVINQRLSKLSPQALNIARAAAVLQSDFNLNLIARVLESRPLELLEAWQELETAQVFAGNGFSHDLLYETVRTGLTPTIGTVLHTRAAEVLSEARASPARIAQHWMEAGEPAKAAPLWLEAAEQADHAYRWTELTGFLEQAIRAYEEAGQPHQAFEARIWAVGSLWRHDSGPQQTQLIEEMQNTAQTPQQHGEAWSARAWWAISASLDLEAERAARNGLAALGDPQAHPETAGKLLRALCDALNNQGRYDEALKFLEQANRLLEPAGDEEGLFFNALNYSNILLNLHRHQEVIEHNQKLLGSLQLSQNKVWRAESLRRIANSQFFLAQYEAALHNSLQAEAILGDIEGIDHVRYEVVAEQGWAYLSLERFAEAMREFRRAESYLKPHESRAFLIEPLGALYRMLGAWEQLEQAIENAERDIPANSLYRDLTEFHRLLYRAARGQTLPGTDFAEIERRMELSGWDHGLARMRLEHAMLVGPEEGLGLVQKSLGWARAHHIPGMETEALAYLTRTLLRLGRVEEALKWSAQALERLDTFPPPSKRALVWLARYEALKAAGEPLAGQTLQQALDWIDQVAQRHVPQEFRQGYLSQNPINAEVLRLGRLEGLS